MLDAEMVSFLKENAVVDDSGCILICSVGFEAWQLLAAIQSWNVGAVSIRLVVEADVGLRS